MNIRSSCLLHKNVALERLPKNGFTPTIRNGNADET